MPTHQFNHEMLSDDHFIKGELKFLSMGNECRLLDKRRTPGVIKSIDMAAGFFRWEISDFEDKGKFWDIEFEGVSNYQFNPNSVQLPNEEVDCLRKRIEVLNKFIEIKPTDVDRLQLNEDINLLITKIEKWLLEKSDFFRTSLTIDFQSLTGPELLRKDFNQFMSEMELDNIDAYTTEIQVMNPNSGDWIKAMQIVMAEIGLKNYLGRDVRSQNAFQGIGSKQNRKKYIQHRLAFLRAFFGRLGLKEVELYRGMSTEWDWKPETSQHLRFWSSWTFNYKVAQDFAELNPQSKHKNSYLLKRAIPVDQLFMTFLETDAMNQQYKEAEGIVLHNEQDRLLW